MSDPAAQPVFPPGPPLPQVVQTALLLRYWSRFASACRRRYGPVFTLDVASMGKIVYLAEPSDIKTVFAGDPSVYRAGEANAVMRRLLGDSSVLLLDQEAHRDRRRLMLPPFHRDAVARQGEVMTEVAVAEIESWPVGEPFAVAPRMAAITLEVILRTVIGTSDPARLARLRSALPPVVNMGLLATLAMAHPELLRRRPWRGVRRRLAEADRLLHAEIADRRADPELATRTDVLSMLARSGTASGDGDGAGGCPADAPAPGRGPGAGGVEAGRPMTDTELRDQLMTLLFAGHETTATGLSWALERLTRHPAALARAVAAAGASAAGDPAGDAYLDAVVRETLRVRPVVFDVARRLSAPVELAGYSLPAGTIVAPGIGLVHAAPEVYPDPGRFDPDRMLGAPPGPTTWLPFGGGGRRCLGATFAQVEMRIVLGEVLRRVELEPTTARAERQRVKHVTLVPHRGARIRVRARRRVAPPHRAEPLPAPGA